MSRMILSLILGVLFTSPAIGERSDYDLFPVDIFPTHSNSFETVALIFDKSASKAWRCRAVFGRDKFNDTHCDTQVTNFPLNSRFEIKHAQVSPPHIRSPLSSNIFG